MTTETRDWGTWRPPAEWMEPGGIRHLRQLAAIRDEAVEACHRAGGRLWAWAGCYERDIPYDWS